MSRKNLYLTSHYANATASEKPEMAEKVTAYCTRNSRSVTSRMNELWDSTVDSFDDADKMSSPLQGATMMFLAELLKPKRSESHR